MLAFQGICCAGIMVFSYVAVICMPLADAQTIIYSCPIFTMVLSGIFLGHRLRLFKTLVGLFSLFGVFLVVRPPALFDDNDDTLEPNETRSNVLFNGPGTNLLLHEKKSDYYYWGVAAAFAAAWCGAFLVKIFAIS